MNAPEAQRILDAAAAQLSEHFGAVQIVASRLLPSGATQATMSGQGDWYARKALCQEFVERDQAVTVARAITNEQPPDDGEAWKQGTEPP